MAAGSGHRLAKKMPPDQAATEVLVVAAEPQQQLEVLAQ
jgi:hypothetical protein